MPFFFLFFFLPQILHFSWIMQDLIFNNRPFENTYIVWTRGLLRNGSIGMESRVKYFLSYKKWSSVIFTSLTSLTFTAWYPFQSCVHVDELSSFCWAEGLLTLMHCRHSNGRVRVSTASANNINHGIVSIPNRNNIIQASISIAYLYKLENKSLHS